MWMEVDGSTLVRSCELVSENFRNRTSFGEQATVEATFSEQMSSALKDCLRRLSGRSEVISLPTYAIELPELALAGVRMVATKIEDGTTSVTLRFKAFLGALNKIFREDIGFDSKISDLNSRLSTDVLVDLITPLLNICATMETEKSEVSGPLGRFGQNIANRSHEIRFHTELLNRFLRQQAEHL